MSLSFKYIYATWTFLKKNSNFSFNQRNLYQAEQNWSLFLYMYIIFIIQERTWVILSISANYGSYVFKHTTVT